MLRADRECFHSFSQFSQTCMHQKTEFHRCNFIVAYVVVLKALITIICLIIVKIHFRSYNGWSSNSPEAFTAPP